MGNGVSIEEYENKIKELETRVLQLELHVFLKMNINNNVNPGLTPSNYLKEKEKEKEKNKFPLNLSNKTNAISEDDYSYYDEDDGIKYYVRKSDVSKGELSKKL